MFRKYVYLLAVALIIALPVLVIWGSSRSHTDNYTQLRPSLVQQTKVLVEVPRPAESAKVSGIQDSKKAHEQTILKQGIQNTVATNQDPYSNTKTKCIDQSEFTKPILYLTQTEECGPPYLLSKEALGNPSACRCNVLILSYKERCPDSRKLPHVSYIYNTNTTWNTGRNLLYKTAMQREEKYIYYVLMDDDVRLKYKDGFTGENAWRDYEESLLREQLPVVGLDRLHGRVERILKHSRLKLCLTDFIPTSTFDPMVSAFHFKAISNILPYHTEYDKLSWWYSQYFIHDKALIMYYGYLTLHRKVYALNPKHRHYPRIRGKGDIHKESQDVVRKEIQNEFPESPELLNQNLYNSILARLYCTKKPPPCPTFPAVKWF